MCNKGERIGFEPMAAAVEMKVKRPGAPERGSFKLIVPFSSSLQLQCNRRCFLCWSNFIGLL